MHCSLLVQYPGEDDSVEITLPQKDETLSY